MAESSSSEADRAGIDLGQLDAEDRKLLTLAQAARARTGTPVAAAIRDATGRTYVACQVNLESLQLSAVQACVAAAVSSGAEPIEAAAVVGFPEPAAADRSVSMADGVDEPSVQVLREVGPGALLILGVSEGNTDNASSGATPTVKETRRL